jgi:hypothetical protein
MAAPSFTTTISVFCAALEKGFTELSRLDCCSRELELAASPTSSARAASALRRSARQVTAVTRELAERFHFADEGRKQGCDPRVPLLEVRPNP